MCIPVFDVCKPVCSTYRRGSRGGKHRRITPVISERKSSKPRNQFVEKKNTNLVHIIGSQKISLNKAKIATLNARSLRSKTDIIKQIIIEDNIQILGLTETWLNDEETYIPRDICPNGFTILRADRSGRPGGGVAILCNDSYKPKVINCNDYSSFEHIFAQFQEGSNVLRFLVIYRPPGSTSDEFITEFASLLENIALSGAPLVICGDFNIHCDIQNNKFTKQFHEALHAFGLTQHVQEKTHVKGHILDLLISRDRDSLEISKVSVDDLISDHNLVSCLLSYPSPAKEKRTITYRDIKSIKIDDFRASLLASNLLQQYDSMDLDTLVECYNTELRSLMDSYAPLTVKRLPNVKREPWYSAEIADARRVTRRHERQYRKHGKIHDRDEYNRSFTEWRNKLHTAKTNHLSEMIAKNRTDSKALFRSMNTVMHRTKANPLPENRSSKDLADQFCSFFKTKIDRIRDDFAEDTAGAFDFDKKATLATPLCAFDLVSDTDIHQILTKSADKSCNLDPIPTSILKQCVDIITPVISRIVNLSLQSSSMPDIFKRALVSPLLIEKPNLDRIPSNYRPVSNLPFVSKVIEECVIRQLSKHMLRNDLGEVLQSAYKPGHSTETAIIKVFDEICTGLNNNSVVYIALLDLSAAFDTVDHRILLQRLEAMFGVRDSALDWFKSYFSGRSMQVIIEGKNIGANRTRLLCIPGFETGTPPLLGLHPPTWHSPTLFSDFIPFLC